MVIGKAGRHVPETTASEHILGYSLFNDGSVHERQKHSIYAGKNFAGSGSWGSWIVTANEIENILALILTTMLNGEQVQHTTGDQMIYSIATQISYASNLFPLEVGDVIATSSPDGSGISRLPKRYLRSSDLLEISVSGIGTRRNAV